MPKSGQRERFERTMLPHLSAAYNLARWLMRNETDAEDAVQEAYLRAFRFFDGFQGGDGRTWLLAIVRNTCRTSLQKFSTKEASAEFQEEFYIPEAAEAGPEERLLKQANVDSVRYCIEGLPPEYREVVVMRELEQMSYKEIAGAVSIPLGTVMSRLARARTRLQQCLTIRLRGAHV